MDDLYARMHRKNAPNAKFRCPPKDPRRKQPSVNHFQAWLERVKQLVVVTEALVCTSCFLYKYPFMSVFAAPRRQPASAIMAAGGGRVGGRQDGAAGLDRARIEQVCT
jgi:hypothetical protein